MSRADISAGRSFVSIYVKTAELAHGLVTAEMLVKGFTKRLPAFGHLLAEFTPANIVRNITSAFTKIGDAVAHAAQRIGESLQSIGTKTAITSAGIGAAMLAAAGHFGHAGDALWVLSQRTGASTQMLSGLGFAARQTGATIDEVETGIRMMQKTIGDAANGSKQAEAALGKLGLTVGDLIGKSPDQQFQMMSDGLAGIKDQSLRTSAAVDVLGRSGQSLLPMMVGLRGFMADAGRLGLIVKPEQAQLAEQLVDKFQALKEAVFAGVFAVGEALGPALLDAIKAASDLAIRFRAWVVDNKATVILVGKIALGLAGAGVAAVAIGIAFKGLAVVFGTITAAFSLFGSAVASVAGVLSVVGIVVMLATKIAVLATMFPAVAAGIATVGTAIAGIASGGIMAALGLVGSVLGTIFFEIILPAVAIVAGITAAIATMAAGAVVAAVVFWNVAKPLQALKPVAMAAFDAIKNIGRAFSEGGIQGAANAVIDGLKRVFLQGSNAIVVMIKNTMANLPGFILSAMSSIGGATSAITATITRLFTEMWPAIKLAFDAFSSFAMDLFNALPAFAGYAIGRLNRAIFDGFIALQKWIITTFINVTGTLLKTFVSFGPRLIKAMFTGNVNGLVKEIGMALAAAGGLAAGVMKGDAPDFKPSAGTIAAWQKLSSEVGSIPGSVAKSVGGEAGGSAATSPLPGAAGKKDAKTVFDHTPLEKYREKLSDLSAAFKAGKLTPEEYAAGLEQLKKEAIGIDGTPLDQFRDRLTLLNAALHDNVISSEEWKNEVDKAKETILSIDPGPIATFTERLDALHASLKEGAITQAQYSTEAEKSKTEIFGLTQSPLEQLQQRIDTLDKALKSGAITSQQWREEFEKSKKEILGLDSTPIQGFAKRADELRQQLSKGLITQTEYSAAFKKSQQDFLGLDTNPIDTFKTKIAELREALAKGLITPEQFKLAALDAVPDKIKSIFDETRTPMEKYRKEMEDLEKLRGVIDPETFKRKKDKLLNEAGAGAGPSSFVGYSATAAMSFGAAGGSPQDRLLKEVQEQKKFAKEQLDETRRNTAAVEKLANGLKHRR